MLLPGILVRLAQDTAVHHAAADEQRLNALTITTIDAYRAFLVRAFGFEAVVEKSLLRLHIREPWIEARMRSTMLRDDLRALGASEVELARLPMSSAVHIPSVAHGLGWMFVLERQVLLDGQLRRHLERRLGPAIPTRYLGARGDRPGTSYRMFGESLAQLGRSYSPVLIAHGANDAFRAQHQWYQGAGGGSADSASKRDVRDDAPPLPASLAH